MKLPVAAIIFILLMISACSPVVQKEPFAVDKGPLAVALSGELILGRSYRSEELPDVEVFGLTPEMQKFAEAVTAHAKLKDSKAEALHQALMTSVNSGGRGITYSAYTLTLE
jgi:hypothetical protein